MGKRLIFRQQQGLITAKHNLSVNMPRMVLAFMTFTEISLSGLRIVGTQITMVRQALVRRGQMAIVAIV